MHQVALLSFALLNIVLLATGCSDAKKSEPKETPAEVAPKEAAGTVLTVSKTQKYVPVELEGVELGMSVDAFRAVRKAASIRVRRAYHMPDELRLTGSETDEEMMAKFDARDAQRKAVEAADWPGTEGLYYIDEVFEASPIQKVAYTFKDGILREIILYFQTPQEALDASRLLLGKEYTSEDRWVGPAEDEPRWSGWAFKDRFVLDSVATVATDDEMVLDAGAPASE